MLPDLLVNERDLAQRLRRDFEVERVREDGLLVLAQLVAVLDGSLGLEPERAGTERDGERLAGGTGLLAGDLVGAAPLLTLRDRAS